MIAGLRRGAWTVERIYDTFPRLAERRNNGGGQLSGGEQQMLAISRALLTNPHLLIMDEPTEGLAPVIVAQVEEMLVRLGEEGDIAVLVIEQNIGVATAVSEQRRHHGQRPRQPHHRSRAGSARDRELQQRLLGVGRHSDAPAGARRRAPRRRAVAPTAPRAGARADAQSISPTRRRRRAGRSRSPIARIEAAARTAVGRRRRGSRRRAPRARADAAARRPARRPCSSSARSTPRAPELRFIRDLIAASGLRTRLVDVSTSGKLATCDVTAQEIALNHRRGGSAVFGADRGASVDRDGGSLRQTGSAARATSLGDHQRRRLGRRLAGRAGHARAADRRAEADRLLGRLRRRRPLCRPVRHHDDVFGHRRVRASTRSRARCSPTARNALIGMVKARLAEREAKRASATRRACPPSA